MPPLILSDDGGATDGLWKAGGVEIAEEEVYVQVAPFRWLRWLPPWIVRFDHPSLVLGPRNGEIPEAGMEIEATPRTGVHAHKWVKP
jgi:hypothetical protein